MLEIKNLQKTFKFSQILKRLELEIGPGERVALVGQNGCGKTTLIRCILGLYEFEGEINLFGSDVKKSREEALKKVAFVPQAPPALKNTVKEIVELTAKLCDFPALKVGEIAKELGLDLSLCLDTPFKSLSGGMKQKLLIATALARRPKILIMDEPSANLDPQARSVFFKLLSQLPEETTMLLTSHRVDELAGIVSRVIELDNGVITMDDIVETKNSYDLTSQQSCHIELKKIPPSVEASLREWSFSPRDQEQLIWEGTVPSPDAFRFHATLTRWSGIIKAVSLQTKEHYENENDTSAHAPRPFLLPGSRRNETPGASMGQRALCKMPDDFE